MQKSRWGVTRYCYTVTHLKDRGLWIRAPGMRAKNALGGVVCLGHAVLRRIRAHASAVHGIKRFRNDLRSECLLLQCACLRAGRCLGYFHTSFLDIHDAPCAYRQRCNSLSRAYAVRASCRRVLISGLCGLYGLVPHCGVRQRYAIISVMDPLLPMEGNICSCGSKCVFSVTAFFLSISSFSSATFTLAAPAPAS